MPPRHYVVTAIALALLLAASLPLTMGFSVILFYWLFQAGAWLLAAMGSAKLAFNGIGPRWTYVAMAAPLFATVIQSLGMSYGWSALPIIFGTQMLSGTALSVAAIAAVVLAGSLNDRKGLARAAWGFLALRAVAFAAPYLLFFAGFVQARHFPLGSFLKATYVPYHLIACVGFCTAAVTLAVKGRLEAWIPVAICTACLFETADKLYQFGRMPSEGFMWLTPVFLLPAGAAIFRAGNLMARSRRDHVGNSRGRRPPVAGGGAFMPGRSASSASSMFTGAAS